MPEKQPEKQLRINALTAILLAAAVVFLVVAIVWFASIHPRRGILFVALTIAALVGAWFSLRRTRVA
jgi:lipopolysaccharide export LptBFGC system permease protein LptF